MTIETKSAAELAVETKAAFDAALGSVRAIADEALGKAKHGESLTSGVKELADEALIKVNEAKARMGVAREINALCNVVGKPELAAKAIRSGKSAADVRAELVDDRLDLPLLTGLYRLHDFDVAGVNLRHGRRRQAVHGVEQGEQQDSGGALIEQPLASLDSQIAHCRTCPKS